MTRLLPSLLLFFLGFPLPSETVFAQSTDADQNAVGVPAALGPEAMSSLVSKLNQEQTDALIKLMELLNTSATGAPDAAAEEQARIAETIHMWISGFGDSFASHVVGLPEMVSGVATEIASIFAGRGAGGSLWFLGILILVIAIGVAAEWLFNRAVAQRLNKISEVSRDGLLQTLKMSSMRVVIQIGGLISFTVASLIAAKVFYADAGDQMIVMALILDVVLIVRLCAAVLRFVLAPKRTDLRLVSTDDATAQFLYRHLVNIAGVIGVGLFLYALMEPGDSQAAGTFRFWVGVGVTLWFMHLTWRARNGLTDIIKGEDENLTPGLEKMAAWWPRVAVVLMAVDWLSMQFILSTGNKTLTPGRSALSLVFIVIAPFLDTMIRGIATHLVPPMQGEGPVAEKAYQDTRLSYVRIGRLILFAMLILVLGKLWGLNLRDWAETGLGTEIAAGIVGFLLILAAGYLAWEITNLWINRRLVQEMPEPSVEQEGGEAGGAGLSRIATVLPILRMTLQAAIVTITALLALSQLGVNIAPLLAGAGVLGLAIGFGAQTLVKDVVSGVFFLLDDAFRLGEYVDVGGTEGTVEKISVRSLQLRGSTGPVHVVPYGSMSKLTNMSRDWVIMKLKFTVPFNTDLEKVRKIFKKIGQQIQEVPEYAEELLSPFKSQGAADVTDVGIVVRGKFTTKPGGQWAIRKEIYTRVQKAFEENGIEFARKEVRVQMPGHEEDTDFSAEQKKVVAAAASQAAETP